MISAVVCMILCTYIAFLIAVIILARANNRRTVITEVVAVIIKMLRTYSVKRLIAFVTRVIQIRVSMIGAGQDLAAHITAQIFVSIYVLGARGLEGYSAAVALLVGILVLVSCTCGMHIKRAVIA